MKIALAPAAEGSSALGASILQQKGSDPMRRRLLACGALVVSVLVPTLTSATSISLSTQHFADGALVSTSTFTAAQVGAPAPFGVFVGSDIGTTSLSASWTFSYGAGAVLAASISFGIIEHDSAAVGHQLVSFSVDGVNLTSALDALFEAPGIGTQSEYNVFTLALTGPALAALADGSATFSLTLKGPGICGLPGTSVDCPSAPGGSPTWTGNSAALDFSTLVMVPEPSTLTLLGLGVAALGARARRRRATSV